MPFSGSSKQSKPEYFISCCRMQSVSNRNVPSDNTDVYKRQAHGFPVPIEGKPQKFSFGIEHGTAGIASRNVIIGDKACLLYTSYPCVAQDKPIRTEESLEGTVIYKKTTTFEVDCYTYQCDVDYGSQFVTLYNKENKLTYEKIVYKDTGKTYIGSWSSNCLLYTSTSRKRFNSLYTRRVQ